MIKPADLVATMSERIGYTFRNADLLLQSTTHKSYANEASPVDQVDHNERLEFLGDAVLSLVVSQMLMDTHPDLDEGDLSRMRAYLVNERELSQIASGLDLGNVLRLGKGEERSGGRQKASLLADVFEAVLGAVFLDGGLEAARQVTRLAYAERIPASVRSIPGFDPKSRLQVVLQQKGELPPTYEVVEQAGPDHRRRFTVAVRVEDRELGRGAGNSKKEAEQAAAREVLETLEPTGKAKKNS